MDTVEKLIMLYCTLNRGEYIEYWSEELLLVQTTITLKITRRELKHIIESRLQDKYSPEQIQELFRDITKIVHENTFVIKKHSSVKTGSHILLPTQIDGSVGVVAVLEIHQTTPDHYMIRTAFYRASSKVLKLLKQK